MFKFKRKSENQISGESEWFSRLERALYRTLDPQFKDQISSAALLAVKRSAGVVPQLNMRNRLHSGGEV